MGARSSSEKKLGGGFINHSSLSILSSEDNSVFTSHLACLLREVVFFLFFSRMIKLCFSTSALEENLGGSR